MANESTAQLHVRKNRILTSQLLVPVSLNGSGAKLQRSSQKRKKISQGKGNLNGGGGLEFKNMGHKARSQL